METPLSALLDEKGRKVYTITLKESAYECAIKLNQLRVGALIVMTANDKIEGIVSERDILNNVVVKGHNPKEIKVADIMTVKVFTVPPTMTVREAMRTVTEKRFRHLPVVADGKLLGMISIGDLTRAAMLFQEQQISTLKNYIQGER